MTTGEADGEASAQAGRKAELAAHLDAVRERIAAAARAADRLPADVSLVAVSKTCPASDVELLRGLGQRDFGESRHQEAATKAAAIPHVTWHFVGQLQRNKAAAVGRYVDVVHSLDRPELVPPLASAARERASPLRVFVQVDLAGGDSGRGGVLPDRVDPLVDLVGATAGLQLAGLMAIAPLGQPAAPAFAVLRSLAERVRESHPSARDISAGMSGDFELAIAGGATLVRVGSALFGHRPTKLG